MWGRWFSVFIVDFKRTYLLEKSLKGLVVLKTKYWENVFSLKLHMKMYSSSIGLSIIFRYLKSDIFCLFQRFTASKLIPVQSQQEKH